MPLAKTPAEAVSFIKSHQRVFIHGGAATPNTLIDALVERAPELENVELIHIHTEGRAAYSKPEYSKSFKVVNIFVGENMRKALDYDTVDFLPCFLSEVPQLFRSRKRPIDVAIIQVSPPDKHGYCTLGVSVDVAKAAVEAAAVVIAQINTKMPRIHGDGFVHIDRFASYIEVDEPIYQVHRSKPSDLDKTIGEKVAPLVENGATIQAGIGSIPDAVLSSLKGHKNLGVHTEMWSHGTLDLIKCGAVNNSLKTVHPGKTVSAFIMGDQEVYDFANDNPSIIQLDMGYINDPGIIRRNKKVTAINSAVEIDLTGQVCADSIGSRIISGVGGQMDFIRGASLSEEGKPIIAVSSQTKKGESRIVPILKPGAGVVTTRAHVHFVVTEYGVADLYGKTLHERAKALIGIAHPDHRENLEKERYRIFCRG